MTERNLDPSSGLSASPWALTTNLSDMPAPGFPANPIMFEDAVVTAVMRHLVEQGWTIESHALAIQHGDDIVASRAGEHLIVEAKGAGSSKIGTRRFGQPFTRNQVRSHVSVAVHRALGVWSRRQSSSGLAFPDNPHHREMVAVISPALQSLGIVVFWVASHGAVSVER